MDTLLATKTISISDYKNNPAAAVRDAGDEPFAVLTNNRPSFYVLTPSVYESIAELLFEIELTPTLKKRLGRLSKAISVDIDEL